jgi:thioredoxin reductase (NADPH)
MIKKEAMVIGAGPAGISAALYLSRAGVSFFWLEKGAPGGKILTIPEIANYPGFPATAGADLALEFLHSAKIAGAEPEYGNVISVSQNAGLFRIATDEEAYEAEAVVVATGLANVPTIKGEKALVGKGVSYCATCDGPLYKGKDVGLYGSGDQALEEALYLSRLASRLFVLTPDAEYQGSPVLLEALRKEKNVTLVTSAKIAEISGKERLERILYETPDGSHELALQAFFPLFGEKSASAFLSPLPLALDHGFIPVDENMMSACHGLFAAGDIVRKKVRQVVTAASDGAIASNGVVSYLRTLKEGGK